MTHPSSVYAMRSFVSTIPGIGCMVLMLCACTRAPLPETSVESHTDAFTQPTPLGLPVAEEASQPDLQVTPGGGLLVSWLEPSAGGGHRLRLSLGSPRAGTGDAWQPPVTVAEGKDWFVNWADTPHIYALKDGSLWGHWLRRSGDGPMDYGIAMARSGDGGRSWSPSAPVHPGGTPGDHGFVTFWPQGDDRLGIAWLDSRQKAAAMAAGAPAPAHDAHDHGGGAPMMLRAALHGADGAQQAEWPLDASTCDCCTTSSAMTDRGVVVVYRGRDAKEIRDTRLVRFDGQRWSAPRDVHADGWKIAGCPVNGPVAAARGDTVWVAWYTEADGLPELRAARSDDAGDRFAAPVTIARGEQVLGRVAIALAGEHVLLAWLEQDDGGQRLVLGRYDPALQSPRLTEVARLAARGRASGLPRLAANQKRAWLVWTDTADGRPLLKGALVR